jgi:hypothetical protein
VLQSLSAPQYANMAAQTLLNTAPTEASTQILHAATAEMEQQPGRGLAPLIAQLLAAQPAVPQLLCGPAARVAPAAITGGNLVFFDYTSSGPTHVAVTLDDPATVLRHHS